MSRAFPLRPENRVRHLRLRAQSESDARQASTLVRDALQMATLPEAESGRILLVRKLPLGRISAGASAATIALRVEQAMREVRGQAAPFDRPGAQEANAVFIDGQHEAIAWLARLHARGAPAQEWFWRKLVPGWKLELSRGERWLALLEAAHDLPEAALAVAAVLEQAIEAGVENELLCALPPGLGHAWLHRAGWSAPVAFTETARVFTLSGRHEAVIRQWAQRWGPGSRRLIWLAVMLAVVERPERVADRSLSSRVFARVAKVLKNEGGPPVEPALRTREPAPPVRDETSGFAGLLFLAPIMQRLGLGEALAAQPALIEAAFPARLLRFIGRRVGLENDDPLARVFDEFDSAAPWPDAWEMPGPAREELASPQPRARVDSPLVAWLTAIRRWSRRHAQMGLIALIRRPGKVTVSRTHLEIWFPLAEADIRLRRTALDVDPGWVPWLGRVVRFHYGEEAHE